MSDARCQRPGTSSDGAGQGQHEKNPELRPDAQKLWRTFLIVWLGQLVSLVDVVRVERVGLP
jgi:hypothetical protein